MPQQSGQAGGEGNHPGVLAGPGGVVQAGKQAGPFGPGPGQRPGAVRQVRDRGGGGEAAGAGRVRDWRASAGLGEGGGVLVIVQQPCPGPASASAAGSAAARTRACSRSRSCSRYRPRAGSVSRYWSYSAARRRRAAPRSAIIERGGGVAVDVGARVQPQAAEQPLLARGEVGVGQVERGGHREVLRAPSAPAGPAPRPGRRPARPGSRPDDGAAGGPASRSPAAGTRTAG